ncbi:hypothetical protein K1719_030757 [Acacia pycnantha]|nr:hypothetical protein K1719_030757 [Acacia pycnantha]
MILANGDALSTRHAVGIDDDYEDDGNDDNDEEERSLDLLVRFLRNMFRKVSKRARTAVRSVLPQAISTKLVKIILLSSCLLDLEEEEGTKLKV